MRVSRMLHVCQVDPARVAVLSLGEKEEIERNLSTRSPLIVDDNVARAVRFAGTPVRFDDLRRACLFATRTSSEALVASLHDVRRDKCVRS